MVTAGANQAFTNIVLALTDADDRVVLFQPYYFNHLMALQMTGGAQGVVQGPCDPSTFHPDLDWLERELSRTDVSPPRMVVLVNPCNPTGVLMTPEEVERAAEICGNKGVWLVLDNTYEQFVYGHPVAEAKTLTTSTSPTPLGSNGSSISPAVHWCPSGPHILHVFSFSKAYGMMGWRVGYIAYPDRPTGGSPSRASLDLGAQLLKVQDTIPICPPQLSQYVALEALISGEDYVRDHIRALKGNRDLVLEALRPLGQLGSGVAGGEGAIYLWARLPPQYGTKDEEVVEWLVKSAGVCVIPGSACGCPGYIRVAFANLQEEHCRAACGRLRSGLERLVAGELELR